MGLLIGLWLLYGIPYRIMVSIWDSLWDYGSSMGLWVLYGILYRIMVSIWDSL